MPSLREVRSMIRTSKIDDWNVITGPTYLDLLGMVSGGGHEHPWLEHEDHFARMAFCPEVALGLAFGLPVDRSSDADIYYPWRTKFADQAIERWYVDILWGGMLVDREVVLIVDGAALPGDRPLMIQSPLPVSWDDARNSASDARADDTSPTES